MTTPRNQYDRLSHYKTTVSSIQGLLTCIYVSTAIVQTGKGKLILDSGGWQGATTKKKMNQFSNQYLGGVYSVYQKKFDWYVEYKGYTFAFSDKMDLEKLYKRRVAKDAKRARDSLDLAAA